MRTTTTTTALHDLAAALGVTLAPHRGRWLVADAAGDAIAIDADPVAALARAARRRPVLQR